MKLDRIQIDAERMNGQATIRNLRLTVSRVIELVALYSDQKEIFEEYPELDNQDIQQALMFASINLKISS